MVKDSVIKLTRKMGIDRAIFYSIWAQGWGILAGPITVILVTLFLNPVQQGYYYTFFSLLNMKRLFDLGLSQVSVQLISRSLALREHPEDGKPKSQTASIIHFICGWYLSTGFLMALGLSVAGYLVFAGADDGVSWQAPWLLVVLAIVLDYLTLPLLSVAIGAGFVGDVNKIRLFIRLSLQVCVWFGLLFGLNLYSVALGLAGGLIVRLVLYCEQLHRLVKKTFQTDLPPEKVNWKRDIMPFQIKVSVAWVGDYLAFQGTIPLVFHFFGAEVAGAYGISVSLASLILNVCLSWLQTKAPHFTRLVVQKNWNKLRKVFCLSLLQSVCLSVTLVVSFTLLVYVLQQYKIEFGERFLTWGSLLCMLLAVNLTLINSSLSTLIRAFGDDPMFYITFLSGILNLACVMYVSYSVAFSVLPPMLFAVQALLVMPSVVMLSLRWLSTESRPLFVRAVL